MADKSAIEWTDATWNPIIGCSIVSPGCINCYAMKMAARIELMNSTAGMRPSVAHPTHYAGTTQRSKVGAVWTGKVALAPDHILTQPLRWKRGRNIFVNSMGDLFHESVPDEWIDKVFAVMALCPQHTFQVLTKRAERMRAYFSRAGLLNTINGHKWSLLGTPLASKIEHGGRWMTPALPLPNVWLGVSTERQQEADERIPHLLATPAAVRFISAEPLLGPIDLGQVQSGYAPNVWLTWLDGLDWVIVGGESGHGARPMHPDWARSLRDQCAAAGVPFFFKQWGEWGSENWDGRDGVRGAWLSPDGTVLDDVLDIQKSSAQKPFLLLLRHGKKVAGRLLDGKEHNAFPGEQR